MPHGVQHGISSHANYCSLYVCCDSLHFAWIVAEKLNKLLSKINKLELNKKKYVDRTLNPYSLVLNLIAKDENYWQPIKGSKRGVDSMVVINPKNVNEKPLYH